MKRIFTCVLSLLAVLAITGAATADDKADVLAAMEQWQQKLGEACAAGPDKIVALYSGDGVLWGTISPKIRSGAEPITDYFVSACQKLPKLKVEFKDPLVRVYGGDTAINSGSYTFIYEKDGEMKSLPARYSFTLIKQDGRWLIVDHHSSKMPE